MQISDETYKERIEGQFHNFIVAVLKNKARDIGRKAKQQYDAEEYLKKLAEDAFEAELLKSANVFGLDSKSIFSIGKIEILVQEEALANALRQLSQYKLEIILLYFFLEKTEEEIGALLNRAQQTINYQRKAILKQLKRYLELEELF